MTLTYLSQCEAPLHIVTITICLEHLPMRLVGSSVDVRANRS